MWNLNWDSDNPETALLYKFVEVKKKYVKWKIKYIWSVSLTCFITLTHTLAHTSSHLNY